MFKWWKNFLNKLADASKESFPTDQKLDCCNLNSTASKSGNGQKKNS